MSAQNLVEPLVLAVARTTVAPWCRTRQRSRLAARVRVVTVASPRAPAPCGRGRKRRQGAARQQDGRRGGDRCRHAQHCSTTLRKQACFDLHDSLPLLQPILVLVAVVSGSRWRRTWQARGRCEEQVVPVEFCPGG